MQLNDFIATVPDFPKPGVLFYDISPLLADGVAWTYAINQLADSIRPYKPDIIVGIESRGFLLAAPLALKLGIGFVMIRKIGKLPGETLRYDYNLEYGNGSLEIQKNIIKQGQKIVVVDDVLATGGTMQAAIHMLITIGAQVLCAAFLIELTKLEGAKKINAPILKLLEL